MRGLDAYALRHRSIADNVANAETVGYQRRIVDFEDRLREAISAGGLRRTNAEHLGSGGIDMDSLDPQLKIDDKISDINDLNNVDIDREMAEMAENHLQFSFASKLAKHYFDLLQTSIRGS
jgi:flagellar basal-body rod protein FlgB